jgi:ribosomal protein S6--L-glutamate ligase
MILSFHPIFAADKNLICAGRPPDERERAAIRAAEATILPQGCRQDLFDMARRHSPRVFPDYTARFDYPGKTGQIRLFREIGVRHPASEIFGTAAQFADRYRHLPADLPFSFPFVIKLDWGGEGQNVSVVQSVQQLEAVLKRAAGFERTGLSGFIMQEFIESGNRVLRVVVVGSKTISYWRVGAKGNHGCVSTAAGARIDKETDPDLQCTAVDAVNRFAQATRINLAGFDLLFSARSNEDEPYFLEINYFFGRRGLGGSESYYALLSEEICNWLHRSGLALRSCGNGK